MEKTYKVADNLTKMVIFEGTYSDLVKAVKEEIKQFRDDYAPDDADDLESVLENPENENFEALFNDLIYKHLFWGDTGAHIVE